MSTTVPPFCTEERFVFVLSVKEANHIRYCGPIQFCEIVLELKFGLVSSLAGILYGHIQQ